MGRCRASSSVDGTYEPTVPQDSNDIHEAEWQGDPDVCSFQPRNHVEDEGFRCHAGAVGLMHDGQWQSMLLLVLMNMSCTRGQ